MSLGLYQAAAAMDVNSRWQDLIAQNLAASSVPGYKRQDMAVTGLPVGSKQADFSTQLEEARAALIPVSGTKTSFANGELRATNVLTDIAIDGPGFFEVQLPNGDLAYTRDGEFHINAQGEFVTKEGYLVMGTAGALRFDLTNADSLSVSADGQLSQGDAGIGALRIVEFADRQTLTHANGGYFVASAVDPGNDGVQSTVRQGYLEGSNVSPVMEMASLINAMRNFEGNQRVIHVEDERLQNSIRHLSGT